MVRGDHVQVIKVTELLLFLNAKNNYHHFLVPEMKHSL